VDTHRLRLTPFSPADLLGLMESVVRFRQSFGLPVADELRSYFLSDDVSPDWMAQLRTSSSPDPWLHGFAVVHREDQVVIGSVGFKGPPDESGMVEIAYGIVQQYQGRGYATEATAAGVAFAFSADEVSCVRAHTLPTSHASRRVLEKCGFGFVGDFQHPEDGLVQRWERRR